MLSKRARRISYSEQLTEEEEEEEEEEDHCIVLEDARLPVLSSHRSHRITRVSTGLTRYIARVVAVIRGRGPFDDRRVTIGNSKFTENHI